tara:strand:+ start:654 stop:905 length:252 start_codon:yes stop_codon:yes gene_type:complete
MCICINCKYVDRCITYHNVETNHGVEHISDLPDIEAKNPRIHVSLIEDHNGDHSIEWDVRSCDSFQEELGKWSSMRPGIKLPA